MHSPPDDKQGIAGSAGLQSEETGDGGTTKGRGEKPGACCSASHSGALWLLRRDDNARMGGEGGEGGGGKK